jgi:hypothetical protein
MEPVGERLARMEEKLDALLANIIPLEKRVASLERWKSYVLGLGTAISTGVAWAVHQVLK